MQAARPSTAPANQRSQTMRADVLPPPRRKTDTALPLARGLGWFSIGLGLAELVAPRQLARFIGVTDNTTLIQAMGVREIAAGIGILTQRRPTAWVWARVGGDALDLSLLGAAARQPGSDNTRIAVAAAAVAGVTALDLACSQQLARANWASADSENDGRINVQKTMAVNRPAQELYAYWHNFENLPNFMKHLKSVTTTDARTSHWVAKGPAGSSVEWDAEVTEDRPNELIAWRSTNGDVENSGVVRFVPEPAGRGTIVRVEMKYTPPAGVVGAMVAKLFGEEPEQQVQEDLRRFKRFMETGEIPTIEGQPAGPRGSLYKLLKKGDPA